MDESNDEMNYEPEISEDTSVSDGQQDFQNDTDLQIQDAVNSLSQIEEIQPQNWGNLEQGERLTTLQNVENHMAEIQQRDILPVVVDSNMHDNEFGGFNGEEIRINQNHLMGDQPVDEMVDTIVHEGRHAYQQYAINNPGVISDSEVVDQFEENLLPGNYLTANDYGQAAYENQPIEADAFEYAGQIRDGIYGERE